MTKPFQGIAGGGIGLPGPKGRFGGIVRSSDILRKAQESLDKTTPEQPKEPELPNQTT